MNRGRLGGSGGPSRLGGRDDRGHLGGRGRRRQVLVDLYGDDAGGAAADAIEQRLEAARAAVISGRPVPGGPRDPGQRWDERDCWLIAYPDQFKGQQSSRLQDLVDVVARHLESIVTGVHILPFHPSTSDGGFAVADYASVDPAVGDWADIAEIGARHELMADAVVNHTSAAHPWFTGFLDGDPTYRGWYRRTAPGDDLSSVVRPRTTSVVTSFDRPDGTSMGVWTTFSADQVDLDMEEPAVMVALVDVLCRYLEHGARAVRLDAIAYLVKRPGTPCIHLPETHEIVSFWRSALADVRPDVLVVTETNVPHVENLSYLGDGTVPEADVVYQFTLPPLVLHTLVTGDPSALVAWAPRAATGLPGTTTFAFLASHDGIGVRPIEGLVTPEEVERLADAVVSTGGMVNRYHRADGVDAPYELATTWFSAMQFDAPFGIDDRALARHLAAHAIILALPGMPLLYTHSLFASPNDVDTPARTGHARDLNRARLSVTDLDAELADPRSRARRCLDGMTALVAARRRSPAFHPEARHRVWSPAPGVVAIERGAPTASLGPRAIVVVEIAGTRADRVRLDSSSEHDRTPADDVRRAGLAADHDSPPVVDLAPYGVAWLIADAQGWLQHQPLEVDG